MTAVVAAASLYAVGLIVRIQNDTPMADYLSSVGSVLSILAVSWVVGKTIFSPGRLNGFRVVGAVVVYLNSALLFAALYRLIARLAPGSFSGIPVNFDVTKSMAE